MNWNFKNTYCFLPKEFFSQVFPEKSPAPRLVIYNDDLAKILGCEGLDPIKDLDYLCGNKLWPGSFPLAQAYLGHQFGHLNRLGDGRALLLGEHVTADGHRFDIHLKGSGKTPYSRGGDGRASLGPMLREYIMSEALHHLGIPTSRSLAVVATGESIYRDELLPGAILVRLAQSHIRIGTFQLAAHMTSENSLKIFTDYVINRHDPEVLQDENPYLKFLRNVIERQAKLIAQWMSFGFIHGVMNTDNMMISGETLDYGPCAFIDEFEPTKSFSSIDRNGRYSYANQPVMAQWNLARFAETLIPLLNSSQEKATVLAQTEIERFQPNFERLWMEMLRKKLGLVENFPEDPSLIKELLTLMQENESDWTNTFIYLTEILSKRDFSRDTSSHETKHLTKWIARWGQRIDKENKLHEAALLMTSNNPSVIPRNKIVEEVLSSAVEYNDSAPLNNFLVHLRKPFEALENSSFYREPGKAFSKNYKTFCGT